MKLVTTAAMTGRVEFEEDEQVIREVTLAAGAAAVLQDMRGLGIYFTEDARKIVAQALHEYIARRCDH